MLLWFGTNGLAEETSESPIYSMPRHCNELLPDILPFTQFLDSVARGLVATDKKLAKRLFTLIEMRNKLEASGEVDSLTNPVNILIRKTLCYYRGQRGATAVIAFDDTGLIKFLKENLKELEAKVEAEVLAEQTLKAQMAEYERRLKQNETVVEALKEQASNDASKRYSEISKKAKRRVQNR